ncbi:MAG TPA: GAF domain-containing protein [Chthoniobacter sp.]|nr:GAF domain-containing protein [Chthoniobacter sp.]
MKSPTAAEQSRVEALREYAIMDTTPEEGFDDISRLTSFICGTPIATITLLDLHRQWFKAKVGLEATETPISDAICATAIQQNDLFLVPDTREDQRFANFNCVTGNPHIRFYAGAPLFTPQGVAIGTLCAIDRVPRELTPEQKDALLSLSRQVITMLELRRTVKALDTALAEKRAAEAEVETLRELLPMCAWCRKIRDDEQLWHGLEEYFTRHSNTRFSHGICPECAKGFRKEIQEKTVRVQH